MEAKTATTASDSSEQTNEKALKAAEKAKAKEAKDKAKSEAKEARDKVKKEKADKIAAKKLERANRVKKDPKPKKLTLTEINSILYCSGKTKIISPVEREGSHWQTSSSAISNESVLLFTKSAKGVIVATLNGENAQTLKTKAEVEEYISEL